jgi:hypothetical protein
MQKLCLQKIEEDDQSNLSHSPTKDSLNDDETFIQKKKVQLDITCMDKSDRIRDCLIQKTEGSLEVLNTFEDEVASIKTVYTKAQTQINTARSSTK